MPGVAPQELWRSSTARPCLRWQRPGAGRPYRGVRQNAGYVAQLQRRDVRAQFAVIAIASIDHHHAARQPGRARPLELLERDLMLGLEANVRRNARLAQPVAILRPLLWQVQPIGHRQAGIASGNRQRDTATWQLSSLPSWPQYCRATPTECRPCFGKLVSSMIHASIGPCRCICGSTIWRTWANTFSSDQRPSPTKCSNDWCCAATRAGAVTAAIGSALLALTRHHQPGAVVAQRSGSVLVADHPHKSLDIGRKPRFTVT